ncbi:hypothetical protein ACSBR2_016286 [Camellia fascicularis]
MRKICILELLSAKNVRSFCSIREDGVLHLIKSIKMSSGSPINLTEKVFTLMNAITSRAAFGRRFKQEDELIHLVNELVSLGSDFNVSNLFSSLKFLHVLSGMKPKLVSMHRKIDVILENIIHHHKKTWQARKRELVNQGKKILLICYLDLWRWVTLSFILEPTILKLSFWLICSQPALKLL